MSIIFRCECGRAYELADVNAGRTIHCLNCKRPITVPAITRPEPPPAASTTAIHAGPAVPQHRLGSAASRSDPPAEAPSIRRGFNPSDLAFIVSGILMAAAFLWYFIGYRLFGGGRLYLTGVLLLSGLYFLVTRALRDMQK